VPGVDELQLGQRFATIFRLVDFEPDRHITIVNDRATNVFGETAISYVVVPEGTHRCRLVVKLLLRYPGPSLLRPAIRSVLPLGDLVMMRRQLLNWKGLTERDAARGVSSSASRP